VHSFESTVQFSLVYVVLIFKAPVTRDVAAVKTDAAVWAGRIVDIIDNLSHVEQLAAELKQHIRTDEMTKQSYDNFYSECLGICVISFILHPTVWAIIIISFA